MAISEDAFQYLPVTEFTVSPNKSKVFDISPSKVYKITVGQNGMASLSPVGIAGYYGECFLLIDLKQNASVQLLNRATVTVVQVDRNFQPGKTHYCSVKFFGDYIRFYIIDKW